MSNRFVLAISCNQFLPGLPQLCENALERVLAGVNSLLLDQNKKNTLSNLSSRDNMCNMPVGRCDIVCLSSLPLAVGRAKHRWDGCNLLSWIPKSLQQHIFLKKYCSSSIQKNKRNKKRRRSFAPKKAENLPQTSRLPQATTKIRASDQKFHNLSMSAGLMSRSCGGCFPGFGHQWGFPWFTHCLQMSSNDWGSDQNLSDFGAVYFKQPHHLGNESWLCLCREKPAYWDECRRVWNGIQYFLPWALHK